jgi:pimeloyl-ACP methyl ester carboxylesterase
MTSASHHRIPRTPNGGRPRAATAIVLSLLLILGLVGAAGSGAGAAERSTTAAASIAAPGAGASFDSAATPGSALARTGVTASSVAGGNIAKAQAAGPVPIVFVHGYLGSGAQYRSPAMRFASNGYPANRIRAFDYNFDSSGLDAFIDGVRREFGVDKVYVAAHSLGTAVMLSYLLNPTTAAKVAKYVALDGVGAICLWGTQCTSITAASMGQTHIEASLSPESFARQYQFFLGQAPATTTITPTPGTIQIAGRALYFQVNQPAAGSTGQLWAINGSTGVRTTATPQATFTIGADGNFGPLNVTSGQPYEITISRSDTGVMHYYYQPFIRSTYLLRLQVPQAGSAQLTNTNVGPNHAAIVVLRYREWWRSHGAQNDDITLSTTSAAGNQPATNILSRVTGDIAGVHAHDNAASPRQTTLDPLNYFSSQPFQTGVDVYMPAAATPNGTIHITNNPRGNAARQQVVNVPNWASLINGNQRQAMLVEFNDYVQ